MLPDPVVSVVIPTYNHRDYIGATLASVFAQSYTDYEIIVVNDGSPDDTGLVLQPLVEAGKIRYLEQPNAGQAAARNRGIGEARGQFVALLDDDDLWPPDKLSWQVELLLAHPDWVLVGGRAGRIRSDGELSEPAVANGEIRRLSLVQLFQGNPMDSPGQALVRKAALDACGGFDPAIWGSDDMDLWIRLAGLGAVAMVGRCALYYRLHATNASRNAARMFWSGVTVIRKNLRLLSRAERRPARRDALRALYMYSGGRVVSALRSSGGRAWQPALRVLLYLAVPMARDLALAKMVGRDLLRESKPIPAAENRVHP